MKNILFYLILFSSLVLQCQTGKVIKISDGDTFTILDGNLKQHKIRIADIDCPEKGQPFGNNAKLFTSNEIYGKQISVSPKDANNPTDKWGRTIGYVIYDTNKNLSLELLKNGLAWHYKYYSDSEEMAELERKARKEKIGLWQLSKPINPYLWRKGKRNSN